MVENLYDYTKNQWTVYLKNQWTAHFKLYGIIHIPYNLPI